MRRLILAALAAAFSFSCVSATTNAPTKERPRLACVVSCPGGWLSQNARVCRGPRWFRDVVVSGEHVTRGADGGLLTNVYTTEEGDFDKRVVELQTCSSYIQQIVRARDVSERGQHPGEDEQGRPQ